MPANSDALDLLKRMDAPQAVCDVNQYCPAIFELAGDLIAVVGTDRTGDLRSLVAPFVGVAPYERIVVIPRLTFDTASAGLPV